MDSESLCVRKRKGLVEAFTVPAADPGSFYDIASTANHPLTGWNLMKQVRVG